MNNAVIVDAVRTPVGRRNGVFKDYHPVDLASRPLEALVEVLPLAASRLLVHDLHALEAMAGVIAAVRNHLD